jgi:Fe2+ or Zn2+ uptake regulation protein
MHHAQKITKLHEKNILREVALKATPTRIRILEILRSVQTPLSIQGIIKKMGKNPIEQTTIYRTLNSLRDAGVVRQVDFQHAHAHYELIPVDDHHHVICVHCGKAEDFVGCINEKVVAEALKQAPSFGKVLRHSLELFAVCRGCQKKMK